jgi:hypothetical protein
MGSAIVLQDQVIAITASTPWKMMVHPSKKTKKLIKGK